MVEELLYSTRRRAQGGPTARGPAAQRGQSSRPAGSPMNSQPSRPQPARRDSLDDPWADDPDRYVDEYANRYVDRVDDHVDRPVDQSGDRSLNRRPRPSHHPRKTRLRHRYAARSIITRRWLPWVAGGSLLLLSDWQLGSAAAAGGAVVWLVYRTEPRHWQALDRQIQGWLRELNRGENGKLTLALVGGGAAMLSTYVAAAVLGESTGWLGAATVLQGFGTLGALALLVRHWFGQPTIEHDRLFHRAIERLSDRDPLSQLAAARQLGHLADRGHLDATQTRTAADCVRLLLQQGCDRPVHEAAWDTLAVLEPVGAEPGTARSGRSTQPVLVRLPRVTVRSRQP